ncbi:HpcH/HpaI aldolase family protein [Consotaella salsifontis]|uniref:2-keto-3-deoxy-L-rhamnonate aldolase RhmA n=1 Tax=Consotaella salsifontis TaxID=1365950 RepID=A0A1T4TCJ0_9HYPH|nr:aldolase/citrate lyase family protein [Consotaella salsifontis]SKA38051.1 2-keto-3-deoxy-L-rhamnonate aldolase RhmA [Consotaella salsifontis]
MSRSNLDDFRARFRSGEKLFGTFLKTPTTHASEILGSVGFDFAVIDEEHAPFNRETTDQVLLACRASSIAGIVRVQGSEAHHILSVLDCGATGVLVPHVDSEAKAKAVVDVCRYATGARGFSNTTRAGTYGRATIAEHVAAQDASVTVIAMIEDPQAIDVIDRILAVDGIDGVFIGRGDLTVAYRQFDGGSTAVADATDKVLAAASHAGKPACVLAGSLDDAAALAAKGASAFILSSDQGLMRLAAIKTLADFTQRVAQSGDGR